MISTTINNLLIIHGQETITLNIGTVIYTNLINNLAHKMNYVPLISKDLKQMLLVVKFSLNYITTIKLIHQR